MPTNAQYRTLIDEMSKLFHRFIKEEVKREGRTEPGQIAKPPTPERVWECPYHDPDIHEHDYCGMAPSKTAPRSEGDSKPFFWHTDCWAAYQIKTLRGMVEELQRAGFGRTWTEQQGVRKRVTDQLAEMYPEPKDTP